MPALYWPTDITSLSLPRQRHCRFIQSAAVSHIPTAPELSKLRQVLCYDGYLTPQNPSNGHHCIGASYHRGETDMQYSEADQQQNRQRTVDCFPDASWAKEVDVSEGQARCGVRCATRDHLPMAGNVPDYDATLEVYQILQTAKKRR